jgi:Icc protein
MSKPVSWIHFGDLHISGRDDHNYQDLRTLIDEANRYMQKGIAFAVLPGDNADDGEEDQYVLVCDALSQCRIPVQAITGDHDIASGNIALFLRYLADTPYRSFGIGEYRFIFLNSVANWNPPAFGLGQNPMAWLRDELDQPGKVAVFTHAYPSEHGTDAGELVSLLRKRGVLLVEMGHTHYNEVANDGRIIYATTRSTGQIEEGPPGFSVTTLDHGVVSWKFKPMTVWPLVMITSPADERLVVNAGDCEQVVRGQVQIRARVWGDAIESVDLSIDGQELVPMEPAGGCDWRGIWESTRVSNGSHIVTVTARTSNGRIAEDRIAAFVHQRGEHKPLTRHAVDYDNALGAWPEKHILGTQLGPNENGRHWPSRRERESLAR